jgi:hypothetical protein
MMMMMMTVKHTTTGTSCLVCAQDIDPKQWLSQPSIKIEPPM